MARAREVFICRSCGITQARWIGKCPDCGAWDSLEPQRIDPDARVAPSWDAPEGEGPRAAPIGRPDTPDAPRLPTGIGELDRVLGGGEEGRGLVPGSVVLIGGAPGIGKSTLMLQASASMASRGERILYISSEESTSQVRTRARRLGAGVEGGPAWEELFLLSETNLARIIEQARQVRPRAIVIDSIQMVHIPSLDALPGSMAQLRRCCADLVALAKGTGIAVALVGHVTKDGRLAGPRMLEHLVDAVLQFEGDRYHAHRIVRAVKNRFGTTMEIGIFEMGEGGLRELPEGAGIPAQQERPRPGAVVCPVVSGTRSILVEIQALTATGFLGAAKRKASGLDPNRLAMLVAVLEQHAGMRLADRDLFASAAGGVRILDPGADLALLLAIAGAQLRRSIERSAIALGEVGLGGEVRPVAAVDSRLREAVRLGYSRAILPAGQVARAPRGLELDPVRTIDEAIERLA